MGQHHLLLRNLRDPLLDRAARYEAVDHDTIGLADTMGAAERLDVVVGVPVGVVDDDRVGGRQVDPETSSSRGEEEAKLRSIGSCGQEMKSSDTRICLTH